MKRRAAADTAAARRFSRGAHSRVRVAARDSPSPWPVIFVVTTSARGYARG